MDDHGPHRSSLTPPRRPRPCRPARCPGGILFAVLLLAGWLQATAGAAAPLPQTTGEPRTVAEPPEAAAPAPDVAVGELVEGVESAADPTQTYTLYLPSDYTPEDARPALVILDPRGRGTAAAEVFREGAEDHGWILLSSDNSRSDGDAEPNLEALQALFPELARRWAVDPRRVYLAGMSGTAVVAWGVAKGAGAVAGVITAAGPHVPDVLTGELDFAHFGAVGRSDFNFLGMRTVDQELEAAGVPHRLAIVEGGHGWMSPARASEALAWMELQAMRTGLVPVDADLVRAQFLAGRGQARALEAEGRLWEAAQRYREVLRAFRGLVGEPNLAPLEEKLGLLAADPALSEEQRAMSRWDAEEVRLRQTLATLAGELRRAARSEVRPPTADALRERLNLDGLLAQAEGEGAGAVASYDSLAARRMLATIATQMGFYLRRELWESGAYREVAAVLEVAASIPPVAPSLLYDLARAHALAGREAPAYQALTRALDAGFDDLGQLRTDPDLESLRGTEEWGALLERAGE